MADDLNSTDANDGGQSRRRVRAAPMTPQPSVGVPQHAVPHMDLDDGPEARKLPPKRAKRSQSAPSRPDAAHQAVPATTKSTHMADSAAIRAGHHHTSHTTAQPADPERNVKRVAAHEFAKSTFFHGPFTSSHGAMLTRQPPRLPVSFVSEARARDRALLLMPPSMRHQYQRGALGGGAPAPSTSRPPRLLVHHHHSRRPRSADGRERPSPQGADAPDGGSVLHFSFGGHRTVHDLIHTQRRSYSSEPRIATILPSPLSEATSLRDSFPKAPNYQAAMPALSGTTTGAGLSSAAGDLKTNSFALGGTGATASMPSGGGTTIVTIDTNDQDDDVPPVTWTEAMIDLVPLAVPSAISMALTYGLSTIPLAFIGSHMGEKYLNGASVGYFILSIVAQYPICGLTFALDTLVSHEFGRNNTSDVLGLLLQRGILVNLAFAVPVCFLLTTYSYPVLSTIYGAELAVIASAFLRFTPLFLIPLVFFTAFSKFCANQMLPQIPMIAMVCGVVVTPVAQGMLIHLGVEGAMLGMAVAAWVQLLVVILLTFAKKETRQTFGAIRIGEALDWEDVSAYLKLALPSALFVAAEASAFDLTVLLAATLGDAQGAAWSAILNSCLPFVSLAGGLSAAACAKVGASLGSGYPTDARRYAFTAVGAAFFCAVLNSCIIWTFFDVLLRFFGTEGAALEVANSLLPIVPLMHIGDSVQFAFQGVFSGCGQNHKGALILLSSLWAIGFPASCMLAFWFDLGVRGIVMGLTIGLLVESPCMVWAAHRMNWQQLAEDAQEEALEDDEEEEEEEEDEDDAEGAAGDTKIDVSGAEEHASDDDELEEEDESEAEEQKPLRQKRRPRRGRSRTPKPILTDDGAHVLASHRMSSAD